MARESDAMTVKELAAASGASEKQVRTAIKAGRIRGFNAPRGANAGAGSYLYLIPAEEAERFLAMGDALRDARRRPGWAEEAKAAMPGAMTAGELAKAAGLSLTMTQQHLQAGRAKGLKVNGAHLVPADEVARFLAERAAAKAAGPKAAVLPGVAGAVKDAAVNIKGRQYSWSEAEGLDAAAALEFGGAVWWLAKKYEKFAKRFGADIEDLAQTCYLGAMKAARAWRPTSGFMAPGAEFAVFVKQAMRRALRDYVFSNNFKIGASLDEPCGGEGGCAYVDTMAADAADPLGAIEAEEAAARAERLLYQVAFR